MAEVGRWEGTKHTKTGNMKRDFVKVLLKKPFLKRESRFE
jgi:hypothetical protein